MPMLVLIGMFFALVVFGWKGRRIGGEPRCAVCGFDLTGLYSETERCPECGGALKQRGAVLKGRHVRRWRMLTIGLVGLAMCISIGVLASRGLFTLQSIAARLPSGRLIAWSIEDPGGWMSDACGSELWQRMTAGSLESDEQQRLLNALLVSLNRSDWQSLEGEGWHYLRDNTVLLRELASCKSTDIRVLSQIGAFLSGRATKPGEPWVQEWSYVLNHLRQSGVVDDATWDELVESHCAPRIWVFPERQVAPGQEVTIGIDFLQRVLTDVGEHVIEVRLPDGSDFVHGWGRHTEGRFKTRSRGTPGRDAGHLVRFTAPVAPGSHEIAVRVLYSKSEQDLWHLVDDPQFDASDCLVVEDLVAIVVSPSTPTPDADLDISGWLEAHLRPAEWTRGRGASGGHLYYDAKVAVGDTAGSFSASGAIEVLIDDQDRHVLGQFSVSSLETSTRHSWRGSGGGSGSGYGSGGRPADAAIEFSIDQRFAFLGDRVRYFIVFEEVTLPDGRSHNGEQPLEVEMWPDALRSGPPAR